MFSLHVDNVPFKVEFEHINPPINGAQRGTICKIFRGDGDGKWGLAGFGVTRVHPKDQYNKETGRKLAMRYAFDSMGWVGMLFKPLRTSFWKKYFNAQDSARYTGAKA